MIQIKICGDGRDVFLQTLLERRLILKNIHSGEVRDNGKVGGGAADVLYADINPRKYEAVSRLMRQFRSTRAGFGCTLRHKKYPPRFKTKPRTGLIIGGIFGAAIIALLGGVILDTRVTVFVPDVYGDSVTEADYAARIRGIVKSVKFGGTRVHRERIASELQYRIKDLAWCDVTVVGSRLNVNVSVALPPPAVKSDEPCNIVAGKAGVIVEAEVYAGRDNGTAYADPMTGEPLFRSVLERGSEVKKGQLLVNGIVTLPGGSGKGMPVVLYKHAAARIIAECTETREFTQSVTALRTVHGNAAVKRSYAEFLGVRIPLGGYGADMSAEYGKTYVTLPVLYGFRLPYKVYTGDFRASENVLVTYSAEDVTAELNKQIEIYEKEILPDPDRETVVTGKSATFVPEYDEAGTLTVISASVTFTYRENIAQTEAIVNR
ncbi:hypothetical protein FACS1894133_6820 [Clostridia bacterium]|nr:hypothetical protein FACS1894133_6820 [Clostridia bacterium]